MTEKMQISLRLDAKLVQKVDQKRNGIDRSLVVTKLLEGWVTGEFGFPLWKE
jgi:metal-responsive CopG/Arc/MetJ family transcriptional regulator